MSYMNHNAAFAPSGGIQELSFDEIEHVDGGLLVEAAAVLVFVVVVGGAYLYGRSQGYC